MYLPSYRTKKNGVPILRKEEIDSIAEKFISDFYPEALKAPMAIDIDSFGLNYLGLKQDFQYLSHNGIYLGMMVFNDTDKIPVYVPESNTAEYISAKKGTVIIDISLFDEKKERRYRFTMGHECGHHILHKSCYPNNHSNHDDKDEPLLICRKNSMDGTRKPVELWNDNDTMEYQGNHMAVSLLMPKSMVKMLVKDLPKEGFLWEVNHIGLTANTFKVSFEAATYRLKELGILPN